MVVLVLGYALEKIGYHSNFNFECNTESGSKESLSIALGFQLPYDTEVFLDFT